MLSNHHRHTRDLTLTSHMALAPPVLRAAEPHCSPDPLVPSPTTVSLALTRDSREGHQFCVTVLKPFLIT